MNKSFVDTMADAICTQFPSSPVDIACALVSEVAKRQRLAAVRDFANGKSPAYVSRADHVIAEVCRAFGLTTDDLMGPKHHRHIVRPRHLSWLLLNQELHLSRAEIGRLFDRDHTAITHGIQRARSLPEYLRYAADISGRLRARWDVECVEAAE